MIQPGYYRHYKGKLCLVIGIAQHSETNELLVVYLPLYEYSGCGMFVRPLEMFKEEVLIEGKTVKRFEFVGEKL